MIILLPPSEGKSSESGHSTFKELHPALMDDVEPVLGHLGLLKGASIAKFYSLKNLAKASLIHTKNLGSLDRGCIPALERYTGVVYTHLDYGSLRGITGKR